MVLKKSLEELVSSVEKTAKAIIDNTVQAVDQNDDGKLDLSDVSAIAESMGSAVKKGTQAVKESAEEKARLAELKALQPIFPDSLNKADFVMPKFIRVVARDKKRAGSAVCQGSIGYVSDQKGMQLINVFRDSLETFGLMLCPDNDGEFFYVDPSERDRYIDLDEYFNYLKIARVNELKRIAQDLGAKHFKVTYKEEQTSFSEKKGKAHAKAGVSADVEHKSTEKKYSTVEVAAEMTFPGHKPIKPQLKYLQRDPSIQTLVAMRMDEKSPLLHETYLLNMSNSCGMKVSDAVKIDAVLKGMKYSGNTTVTSEARNETRRCFEYEIDF